MSSNPVTLSPFLDEEILSFDSSDEENENDYEIAKTNTTYEESRTSSYYHQDSNNSQPKDLVENETQLKTMVSAPQLKTSLFHSQIKSINTLSESEPQPKTQNLLSESEAQFKNSESESKQKSDASQDYDEELTETNIQSSDQTNSSANFSGNFSRTFSSKNYSSNRNYSSNKYSSNKNYSSNKSTSSKYSSNSKKESALYQSEGMFLSPATHPRHSEPKFTLWNSSGGVQPIDVSLISSMEKEEPAEISIKVPRIFQVSSDIIPSPKEEVSPPIVSATNSQDQTLPHEYILHEDIPEINWNEEFQQCYEQLFEFQRTDTPGLKSYFNKLFVKKQLKIVTRMRITYEEMLKIGIPAAKLIIEGKVSGKQCIPPIDVGGKAGGTKFTFKNIFFKLASDEFGWYKGLINANKSPSHELKGFIAFIKCVMGGVNEIRVPMSFVVEYLGYTIFGSAKLPISSKTLVFGSQDGGKTVICTNQEMLNGLTRASKLLRLKMHKIGQFLIPFPFDLEGHKGEDGRLYVVDFARILPPTGSRKGAYLYELMRNELVSQYKQPLSPDALTKAFGSKQDREEIRQAMHYLFTTMVPLAIKKLEENLSKKLPINLIRTIHSFGINIRYLGKLYRATLDNNLKKLILNELLARSIKVLFKQGLHDITSLQSIPSFTIEFLNKVFNRKDKHHISFWKVAIIPEIESKFNLRSPTKDVPQLLDQFVSCDEILKKLLHMTRVELNKQNPTFPLSLEDFRKINESVKHPSIYYFACGIYQYHRGSKTLSKEYLERALDSEPLDELSAKYLESLTNPNIRFHVSSPAVSIEIKNFGSSDISNIRKRGTVNVVNRSKIKFRDAYCILFKNRKIIIYSDTSENNQIFESKIRKVERDSSKILKITCSHQIIRLQTEEFKDWEESMNQILFDYFAMKHRSYFTGGERLNVCPITYCSPVGYVFACMGYFLCCCWSCLGCIYCISGEKHDIREKKCGVNVCCPKQRWWYNIVISKEYLNLSTPQTITFETNNNNNTLFPSENLLSTFLSSEFTEKS